MGQRGVTSDDLSAQLKFLRDLLDKTGGSVQRAVSGHLVFRDRVLSTVHQAFFFGLQSRGLKLEPKFLVMRGRHFKAEIKAIATWRETRGFKPLPPEHDTLRNRPPYEIVSKTWSQRMSFHFC